MEHKKWNRRFVFAGFEHRSLGVGRIHSIDVLKNLAKKKKNFGIN